MNEQRLAVTVVDGQRDRYIPDIFCSVHKAPHGSGAPSSWPVQTIYISWPGPVRAGDHPWVFYDPLSSRRLEKPSVFAFVSVAWEIKKIKKHCWKRQAFESLWFTTKICCTIKSASWALMCLQWVVSRIGLKSGRLKVFIYPGKVDLVCMHLQQWLTFTLTMFRTFMSGSRHPLAREAPEDLKVPCLAQRHFCRLKKLFSFKCCIPYWNHSASVTSGLPFSQSCSDWMKRLEVESVCVCVMTAVWWKLKVEWRTNRERKRGERQKSALSQ